MIVSFKHKGLERFYLSGNKSGIQAAHATKLAKILAKLDSAKTANDMNIPGWKLHQLQGSLQDHWTVQVNGNWRITFKLQDGNAVIVDYQDYH